MKDLIKVAKELQKVMDFEEGGPPVEGSEKELGVWVKEAVDEIDYKEDKFSDFTVKFLTDLDLWKGEPLEVEEEETTAEVVEEVEDNLVDQIKAAGQMKELKIICKDLDEFKSIRGQLTKYKTAKDLREVMLGMLAGRTTSEPKPKAKVERKEPEIDRHPLNIMPEINKEDRNILLNEILENGYDPQLPIILFEEKILDGWQRYMICQELAVEPTFETFTGNEVDAMQFMLRTNKRRNITSSQRAAIAIQANDIMGELQQEAKEKMKTKGKGSKPVHVDKEVAEMYQTNPNYIHKAKKLKKENPEEFEKVKAGIKSIPQATKKTTKDNPFFESSKNIANSLVNKLKDYSKKKMKPKTATESSNFNDLEDSIDSLIEISKEIF